MTRKTTATGKADGKFTKCCESPRYERKWDGCSEQVGLFTWLNISVTQRLHDCRVKKDPLQWYIVRHFWQGHYTTVYCLCPHRLYLNSSSLYAHSTEKLWPQQSWTKVVDKSRGQFFWKLQSSLQGWSLSNRVFLTTVNSSRRVCAQLCWDGTCFAEAGSRRSWGAQSWILPCRFLLVLNV